MDLIQQAGFYFALYSAGMKYEGLRSALLRMANMLL